MEELMQSLMSKRYPKAHNFWQEVVDSISEAVIVVSPDRRIRYANRAAEELAGDTLDNIRDRICIDAISCPQCNCECRLFTKGEVDKVEVEIYHPGDEQKRIFRKNAKLLHDEDGNVIGGVEVLQDVTAEVTERKAKEARISQLFEEQERSKALLSSLAEGVFTMDKEGRIRTFSTRASELLGYDEQGAQGRNLFELLGIEREQPAAGDLFPLCGKQISAQVRCLDGSRKQVALQFRSIRFNNKEILGLVQDASQPLKAVTRPASDPGFHGIVSQSSSMQRIFSLVESAAQSDITVLIEGESGTGKELVAQAIHRLSQRRKSPFYAVNCATFTGSLLLSELFGHERGAFTGAVKQQRGKLELARGGSLFLDEVSEIPLQHQALLLRVLEERSFERLGGHEKINMNARIIAATNRSLREALRTGSFREDLYYRLKVVPIYIPPLRERAEDILLLTQHFLLQQAKSKGSPVKELTDEASTILEQYSWPGNVRELRNLIEYLSFAAGDVIGADDLPRELIDCASGIGEGDNVCRELINQGQEQRQILSALKKTNFHRSRAAEMLGINRSTLWRKMKRLGIE